jgi:anti-sigma-K factor RskA
MSEKETYNDFESLCAGYVLNALTEEERREFEKLLATASDEQKALLDEMTDARDEMALATEAPAPRDDLFVEILNKISEEPKQAPIIPLFVYRLAAAVLLIGVIGLAFFSQQLSGDLDLKTALVEQQTALVEQQTATITELQTELDRRNELLAILESREVNFVIMAGLDVNPDGYGKVIWDAENQRALLQLANLPAPPEDKDYQLWLIKDEQSPISAGVFNFERPSTNLFFKVEELREDPSDIMNIFAVTLEPKGGMPQPTGDMYLFGQEN